VGVYVIEKDAFEVLCTCLWVGACVCENACVYARSFRGRESKFFWRENSKGEI